MCVASLLMHRAVVGRGARESFCCTYACMLVEKQLEVLCAVARVCGTGRGGEASRRIG